MKATCAWIHMVLAWLMLAMLLSQFYSAGAGIFGAASFGMHRGVGYLIEPVVLLLLVIALVGQVGRRLIGLSALLFFLVFLQIALPNMRNDAPWVAAFHPLNGLVLIALTFTIARGGWARVTVGRRAAAG